MSYELQASIVALESAVKGAMARGCVPDAAWRAKEHVDRKRLLCEITGGGNDHGARWARVELQCALNEAIELFSAHALGIGVIDGAASERDSDPKTSESTALGPDRPNAKGGR